MPSLEKVRVIPVESYDIYSSGRVSTEEEEERLEDEESERASLVSRRSRMSQHSRTSSKPGRGFLSRLMGRTDQASYQPIRDRDGDE